MDGVLIIDKDVDWTSHDVVAKLRNITKIKKIGHTGTLDPLATGVLPICIGRATKLVEYLQSDEKVYIAELAFGSSTDTYDSTGETIETSDLKATEEELLALFPKYTGAIEQVPPMYSAIKQNGVKLYELARKGIEVERKSRSVTISELKLLYFDYEEQMCRIYVRCSAGTYIRSLIFDLGEELGTFAHMTGLNRIGAGEFQIDDAIKLSELNSDNVKEYIIDLESALKGFDRLDFPAENMKALINGMTLLLGNDYSNMDMDALYRVYCDGQFIGLGNLFHKSANGCKLKIKKLLI